MKYRGYRIEPNLTGFVIYDFYKESEELITGNGETIEECEKLIDENILENFEWTDKNVIDFVNWFLELHKLPFRYKLENMEILESFMRGDDFSVWH